ncbi:MAG: exopolysaccharide biosynthesis polyprenyl glycosylphosphotransferase [Oscillospiraceae bacterium]|nr:exopolysaccharide biosynthesis polyprenyl glycosylphosphotransferase [Oscillospiraceae bacterium]
MKKFFQELALLAAKALNVTLIALPVGAAWLLYYTERTTVPFHRMGNWAVLALFVFFYVFLTRVYGAFRLAISRISDMLYGQMLSVLLSDAALFGVICLLTQRLPAVWPMLAALVAQAFLATAWCTAAHIWYFSTFPPLRSAVVYGGRKSMEELIQTYGLEKKFHVVLTLTAEECIEQPERLLDVEAIFMPDVHSGERNAILKFCVEHGIECYILPRLGDIIMSGAEKIQLFHMPMLRAQRYNPPPMYLFIKRVCDIVLSVAALLVLSPFLAATAIAVSTDGGPVFYRQKRLTKDGKPFWLVKFRSMRPDAEGDGVARLSTGEKDERITPVGRVIRKIRMDELPQLLNVLKGDMSLVGPRPERPEIAAQYEEDMPEFRLRLQAKAGLTGYAQVYGKYNTTPYNKLQMDLMYIANPGLLQDLKLLLATVKVLFLPDSTEGIEVGQTTATDGGSAQSEQKALSE